MRPADPVSPRTDVARPAPGSRTARIVAPPFVLGCVLALAGSLPAVAQAPASKPAPTARADSLAQARDAQRDEAVAAALVAALEQELDGRRIRLRLQPATVDMASVRDRVVEGRGEVSIGEGDDWLGLRYRVLYDAVMGATGYPELHLGGVDEGGRVLPNDATLIAELDRRVLAQVDEEFGHQQARMQLDRIVTIETGSRYLRIDAEGLVDFGRDGSAPVRVEGLYDRLERDWLRVAYALEPAPPEPAPAHEETTAPVGSARAESARDEGGVAGGG